MRVDVLRKRGDGLREKGAVLSERALVFLEKAADLPPVVGGAGGVFVAELVHENAIEHLEVARGTGANETAAI